MKGGFHKPKLENGNPRFYKRVFFDYNTKKHKALPSRLADLHALGGIFFKQMKKESFEFLQNTDKGFKVFMSNFEKMCHKTHTWIKHTCTPTCDSFIML